MESVSDRAIAQWSRQQLLGQILPFWLKHGIDEKYGAFFTCFANSGHRLTSTDKYVWSQGRFVAVLARVALAIRSGLISGDPDPLIEAAACGARFLRDHALLPDHSVRYVLQRDGSTTGDDRDELRSIYADCFTAMGFAELSAAVQDQGWLKLAESIVANVERVVDSEHVPTAPYQLPAGMRGYGERMILLNAHLDLARARTRLGIDVRHDELGRARNRLMDYRQPNGLFLEVTSGLAGLEDTLLLRHRTPGHAIEGLWMVAQADSITGQIHGDALSASALALCELGWDTHEGGLFRYVDESGSKPRGRLLGGDYETLVQRTWSSKLWWVHSEALYAMTLLGRRSDNPRLNDWRDRLWNYTARTFPAEEPGEEWIQIRARDGSPLDEVVALPLKDPYHVTRNLLQLLEITAEEGSQL